MPKRAKDIDELADGYLLCHTLGHAWDSFTPMRKRPQFGTLQPWRCIRCHTERHDIVSWVNGELLSREYRYPEGYHLRERHRRQDFRLALLQRNRQTRRRATR